MKYIVHRRFRAKAICGDVNLPAGTVCESRGGMIYWRDKPVCGTDCQNAKDYFAQDEDGLGMQRGALTRAIMKTLSRRDERYQERWDKVWADPACRRFKREDHADFWLWNQDFFNANILTLQHIASIVGASA